MDSKRNTRILKDFTFNTANTAGQSFWSRYLGSRWLQSGERHGAQCLPANIWARTDPCCIHLASRLHGWEVLVEAAAHEKLWHSAITVILINSLQMVDLEFHIVLFWFA